MPWTCSIGEGTDTGIVPALFTMLVLMAIVTTLMTAPLLEWIYFSRVIPREYEPLGVEAEGTTTDLF
jgi:hypothetical protein